MKSFGKDLLRKIKNAQLGGAHAHGVFSPSYRPNFTDEQILDKNPKLAAVNIVLYIKDDEWYFPLILRTENERDRHSGQISLPGGKKEESDKNFGETAIRETCEEIGLEKHYIRTIRELSSIYIPPSNFLVYPFLGVSQTELTFVLQAEEVAGIIELPLSTLLDDSIITNKILETSYSNAIEVPVFQIEEHSVWGATAMMLIELKDVLKLVL